MPYIAVDSLFKINFVLDLEFSCFINANVRNNTIKDVGNFASYTVFSFLSRSCTQLGLLRFIHYVPLFSFLSHSLSRNASHLIDGATYIFLDLNSIYILQATDKFKGLY